MSILDYAPKGFTLRPQQVKALQDVEACWPTSQVIVIPAEVGFGKSLVARTIAAWRDSMKEDTAIITPRVLLQNQYAETFPDLAVLKGKDRYECKDKLFETCGEANEFCGKYCEGCPFTEAKTRAKEENVGVFNFQSYMYNAIEKKNLIIDESHNTVDMLADRYTLSLWKHKEKYPDTIHTHGDLAVFLESQCKSMKAEMVSLKSTKTAAARKKMAVLRGAVDKYIRVIDGLVNNPGNFFVEHTSDFYRGRKQKLLRIRPITVKHIRHGLWPKDTVKKIVMLSATFGELDIDRLGLGNKRVTYLECINPIPADRRPFVIEPVANMAWKNQDKAIPQLAEWLVEKAASHKGEKGIVHVTYAVASKLRDLISDSRFLFHDKKNKDEVYHKFRESVGDSVLVASGMSEGIDLVEEFGRWQVIGKIMYPSLADPLIKRQLKEEPDWYNWQTVRTIRQQTGRIVRSPTDYGVTYMVDSGFHQFFNRTLKFWPAEVRSAFQWR